MNSHFAHLFSLFFKLLGTRLHSVRGLMFDKVVNISIWSFCNLVISGYVMQAFGLAADFGIFQLAGVVATAGLFESYGNIAGIIMDFAGEKSIGYYLTLPTTPGIILLSTATAYACVGTVLSLAMILLGKAIFYGSFALSSIAWGKLIVIIMLANMLYGLLALAIAAHVGQVAKIGNVWSRFIFPLWFLGGFQFSWAAMYKAWSSLAYVLLANPITYIMEGTRAAIIGQRDYISWWTCFGVLSLFTIGCWFIAYNRMKKILDFV